MKDMRLVASMKQAVKYYFYFISLSFYFSYGYFHLTETNKRNGLMTLAAA